MIMTTPCEELTFTEDEFRVWIKRHGRGLVRMGFDVQEIAFLAIHDCHFHPYYVYKILSHFEDAIQGSSFDNKMKMHFEHYQHTIDEMNGKIFLDDHWRDLVKKTSQGRDWDE